MENLDSISEKLVKTLMYDFYGELLTSKQQEFFEAYYLDDFSLSEIGEKFEITRQAVHDILTRTEKKLSYYEEKLQLIDKHKKRMSLIEKIENDFCNDKNLIDMLNKLKDFEM